MNITESPMQKKIYTVSQLTKDIKQLLEDSFPIIWISGEISNFSMPASGHYYFTLKDSQAQISSVMFRGQNQHLKFTPEHGMGVTGLGRISVYEPRGTYQIIFEYLEPKGIGSLQIAFEQLKKRLSDEGLFDDAYKKTMPCLPGKITVITSPSGAVIHDIINISKRRFANAHIEIIPVKVQGKGAEKEIVSGIKLLNTRADSDVAILARGGGSLEDLQAFNSEDVARAVFASRIPIISAIGHETDYTISDFVADLRSPTPSAAVELVLPVKTDVKQTIAEYYKKLILLITGQIESHRICIKNMTNQLTDPKKRIDHLRFKSDDFYQRLSRIFFKTLEQSRERHMWRTDELKLKNPGMQIKNYNNEIKRYNEILVNSLKSLMYTKKSGLCVLNGKLNVLSPTAILDRGYSITRTVPDSIIVKDAKNVSSGQDLEILVSKGLINCQVKGNPQNGNPKDL